jgi:enoyl-CoA hydratase/3-hydroxyacyl-CoA dehydrogenase
MSSGHPRAPARRLANPALLAPARPLPQRIGVVGAGTIGPDIGYHLASELPNGALVLIDINPQALAAARERVAKYAGKGVKRGKLSANRAAAITQELTTTSDYGQLGGCDWVIEAASENLLLKRKIFAQIEAVVRADTLITSNTSSLPAERLFSELQRPERATVTHFFAPAFQNPIVEVIDWSQADPQMIDYLRWVLANTGKVPLMSADRVCFMLDRIFDNWCNESGHLLEAASAAQIDTVAQELAQAGPFYVLNLANGNPIIIETNSLQAEEEGAHYRPAGVFASVSRWRTIDPGQSVPVPQTLRAAIRDRLLGILFSQTFDILDRDIGTAADLNLGCRLAFGLRRGPLALMRELGEPEVDRIMARLAAERPGLPLKSRPLRSYMEWVRDVLVDDVAGIRVITIRRPDALNALHDELNDEILTAIRDVEDDPAVTGFVITGFGTRAFCAGADIGRFPGLLGDNLGATQYARDCSRLLRHLDAMRKPVVAALNGMALGGGLELAIRAHGIVAVQGAMLQFPEITLGIVPGIGAMVVPFRRWPRGAALVQRMLRTAERVSVEHAEEFGIIDACVQRDQLLERSFALVERLAGRPRASLDGKLSLAPATRAPPISADGKPLSATVLRIMERAVAAAATAPSLDEALEVGYQAFGESACTAAAREGIEAFLARRPPNFANTD